MTHKPAVQRSTSDPLIHVNGNRLLDRVGCRARPAHLGHAPEVRRPGSRRAAPSNDRPLMAGHIPSWLRFSECSAPPPIADTRRWPLLLLSLVWKEWQDLVGLVPVGLGYGHDSKSRSIGVVGVRACASRPPLRRTRPARGVEQRRRLDLLIRETRQVTVYRRRRRACLRIASTFAANAVGSMIGVQLGDSSPRGHVWSCAPEPGISGRQCRISSAALSRPSSSRGLPCPVRR